MNADEAADLFAVRTTIEVLTAKRCVVRFRCTPDHLEVDAFASQLGPRSRPGVGELHGLHRSDIPPLNTDSTCALAQLSADVSMLSILRQVSSKIKRLEYG